MSAIKALSNAPGYDENSSTGPNETGEVHHLRRIFDDNRLESIPMCFEQFLEIYTFACRTNSSMYSVPSFKQCPSNPDTGEAR